MSPEQCRGERDLTAKSDLYSLGIVFFELLTGRKPFEGENAMEVFMKHVNEPAPRPVHQPGCLDIPGWLDTLVHQLMEKKPEHRPLNAAMVFSVLQSIREKIEAQQSAGVEAAKKKLLDTPRAERKLIDDTDREAARILLGGKARLKKKRKQGAAAIFGSVWFQIPAIAALLAGTALTVWLVFRPPAPEKLYEQARKLMESNDPAKWDEAIDDKRGPITFYLKHYDNRPGEQTKKVREWQKQAEDAQGERLLERSVSHRKLAHQNDAEEAAFKAVRAEADGKLDEAKDRWEKVRKDYGPGSGFSRWGRIAEQHAELVGRVLSQDKAFEALSKDPKAPELTGYEKDAMGAFVAERSGNKDQARKDLVALKGATDRFWALYATYKLREMNPNTGP